MGYIENFIRKTSNEMAKGKANINPQHTTKKTKDWETRTQLIRYLWF